MADLALVKVDDLPKVAQSYSGRALVALAKLAVRDRMCPSGHSAGHTRQHLAVTYPDVLLTPRGTYASFSIFCRTGGCGYTSPRMALLLD